MQTETLNIITRNILINKGLPLHYYLPTLHRAIMAVRDLSKDINMGTNIKKEELEVFSDRASYLFDCNNILRVYGLFGGQEKAFTFNNNISTIFKNGGYLESDSTLPDYRKGVDVAKEQTSYSIYPQVFNLNYPTGKYEYNIDREFQEIVLSVGHGVNVIYVTYLSSAISVSSANLVPYMAQEAISAFIEWETARNDGSPQSKVAILKDEYYTQKVNLKAAFNPMTIEDFTQSLNQ